MLKKMHKTGLFLMISFVMGVLLVSPLCFAQKMPEPGTTIDKSNYKQYAHLFPEEWLKGFEDGFEGLLPLFKVVVTETKRYPISKMFQDYSSKNRGKYSIDESGNITPFFNREGLPFPDLQPTDQYFLIKLMWNYDCKYQCDVVYDDPTHSLEKRHGEPVRIANGLDFWLYFKNRMKVEPKPDLPNPIKLYKSFFMQFKYPVSVKNTIQLMYRYVDTRKPDDSYMYLPSLRRVLRAEANQRSTPMVGSVNAPDDLGGFDGRIPDFTYTLVKEQKVLAIPDNKMIIRDAKKVTDELPMPTEGYQIRDVYVIDIKSKDSKYPQSRKRIYLDKETLWPFYGVAWDRAGKLWKLFGLVTQSYPLDGGQGFTYFNGGASIDVQFGMAAYMLPDPDVKMNYNNFSYNDVTPAALQKAGR